MREGQRLALNFLLKERYSMDHMYQDAILAIPDSIPQKLCEEGISLFHLARDSGFCMNYVESLRKDEQLAPMSHPEVLAINEGSMFFRKYISSFFERSYPLYRSYHPILDTAPPHDIIWAKIQKTPIGGGFHNFHAEQNGPVNQSRRLVVYMTYLNDVEEGGETEFLNQSMRIEAKAGTTVLFPVCYNYLHRGNPPISNEKYIITGSLEIL